MSEGRVWLWVELEGKALSLVDEMVSENKVRQRGMALGRPHFVQLALTEFATLLGGDAEIIPCAEADHLRACANRLKKYEQLYGNQL